MKVDVLIIGGGPTGLTMASLLKRSGVSCRIIDKGSEQARESRALGIQARTLELFQNMGIVDEFLQQGQIASGMKMFFKGKERASLDFSSMGRKDTPYPYIFFLSQAETEKILIEDLLKWNVSVERKLSLKDFTQNTDSVTAVLEHSDGHEETVEANYMIGCDGSHSEVRHKLGLSFEGGAYEEDFILADAKLSWPYEHDKLMIFLDAENVGVHFPLRGGVLSRILAIRRTDKSVESTNETTSFPATLEEVEKSFSEAIHQKVKLSSPEWVARFRVHHRGVNKMREGRVFVAGDAAHIHSPIGAQGMNTGIQDATNLAWKLAMVLKGSADESILDSYNSERLPIIKHLLNFTDRIFEMVINKNPFIMFLKNIFIPLMARILMRFNRGKQFLFGFVSQLEIRYHESSVVVGEAGKRMPNFKMDNGMEIFDLITGYRFHLLVFGKSEFNFSIPGVVIHNLAADGFKKSGLVLVRPDGYIAYQSDIIHKNSLEDLKKSMGSFRWH